MTTLAPTRGNALALARKWTTRFIGSMIVAVFLLCLVTLPITLQWYNRQDTALSQAPPQFNTVQLNETDTDSWQARAGAIPAMWFGMDNLGRSLLWRCLMGGTISLGIGVTAALIAAVIGSMIGMLAGYRGGWVDSILMRGVDVLYGLPYILIVVLLMVGAQGIKQRTLKAATIYQQYVDAGGSLKINIAAAGDAPEEIDYVPGMLDKFANKLGPSIRAYNDLLNLVILLIAISAVNWLTLSRVVRGQALSLRDQPFIEAARAAGLGHQRIMFKHILPNLLGPIIVYTTLAAPQAILQESFLSFLGIGVTEPIPSWGNLASSGLQEINPVKSHWWLLAAPCAMLGFTLLSLNLVGDSLRDRFDPRGNN